MNPFDHFVKEGLHVKYYLRYTDDFILLDQDPEKLRSYLPHIEVFLRHQLNLTLHPNKIVLRKLRQGVDFLGYVTLPKYRLLRKRTKERMVRKIKTNEISKPQLYSYLGLLSHAEEHEAELMLRRRYLERREKRY